MSSCLSFFSRPRLMARIQKALEGPLLCVVAPIGYGKTMTMQAALPPQATWQTMVSDSPSLFRDRVVSFFRPYSPAMADQMSAMGFPSTKQELDAVLSYLDTFSFEEPAFLVLDDCHVLPDPTAWRFIELLARRQVKNLHVVLISRNRLPLALEDLRLKGLAVEIGSGDLAFSAEDIQGFFRQNGLRISTADSRMLFEATNGWISSVYLYATGYKAYVRHQMTLKEVVDFSDFFENYEDEQMHRLLSETVYRPCTEEEKNFLTAMCRFDGFTLDAVDFIMDRMPDVEESPRRILQNLLKLNSFVSRNASTNRYEIHPALLRFLRKRLHLQSRTIQDPLYKLWGDWYLHTNDLMAAVSCYLEGHHYAELLRLFVARQEIFNDFEHKALVVRCFNECPVAVKREHLLACLLCAKSFLLYSELSLFKRTLFDVQSMVNDMAPGAEKNWAQGELELLLAFTCLADLPEMYDHLMRATFLMEGKPSQVVGRDFPFGFGANELVMLMYQEPGKLAEMKRSFLEIIPTYMSLVPGGGVGAAELLLAEVAYCQGNWNESYDLLHEAMDKALEVNQTAVLLMCYHLLLHLAFIHGDYREYELVHREITRVATSAKRRELRYSAQLTRADGILLSGGDLKQLPEWLLLGRFYSEELLPPVCQSAFIRYGRLLIARESYQVFLSFYRDMENLNRRHPSNIMMIYGDIYRAVALFASGKMAEAEEALTAALCRAQADRIYVPFVENMNFLKKLLPFLRKKNPDFMEKVEELQKDFDQGIRSLIPFLTLSRLFTDRENEILACLKKGYTNKQIAAELFIAEVTVKKTLARIAGKLGVKGRMNILRALAEMERRTEG